ncbi:MAG: TolB family protein [Candidatus Omnitrophica bacterium]|nr:TolB family protein [Candidatus Omnitrophota bacterium]
MLKKFILLLLLIGSTMNVNPVFSQNSNLGDFEGHNDVGKVKNTGSVQYDPDTQEYTIQASGTNMWFDRDEFHFVWKRIKGDFILRARMKFIGKGVDAHRKMGWIVRNSLDTDSVHVNASIHGDGLTSLQFRKTKGGETEETKSKLQAPDIVQLERQGNTYIMSVAKFGEPFISSQITLDLNHEVFVGLYVCSHNPEVSEKAIFTNVRLIVPAKKDFQPYRDYIGSRLEVMEIQSGHRKVLYTDPNSIQAPNWMLDGNSLIYNNEGLLYKFDLSTNTPTVIDTGFANKNNNDHVLSFDGKHLGISHHSSDADGASIIYTIPVKGGTPKRVTSVGPSYLHGWSPDGENLIYTGGRNGQYDIYKISIAGGQEIQLTNTKGLDDGSEYSPDGKFIYFNSNRTGTMQIWRMKPDGSEPTQITFDEYQDWFPHISPDGKWIVFLSFPQETRSDDHPFYKHVYLRLISLSGGTPKIAAYIYGGQGTINVPSWSPDSTHVTFVSNSMIGE